MLANSAAIGEALAQLVGSLFVLGLIIFGIWALCAIVKNTKK